MNEFAGIRRRAFAPAIAAGIVACIVVVALPDSFVSHLLRNRSLTDAQAGWAYGLIALAAVAQAMFGGFRQLSPDRIAAWAAADVKMRDRNVADAVRIVARNAATFPLLTLVYGGATVWITGQRGGFWLFPIIAAAQGGWYFRRTGEAASRMETGRSAMLPEDEPERGREEPQDFTPALARGLAGGDHGA